MSTSLLDHDVTVVAPFPNLQPPRSEDGTASDTPAARTGGAPKRVDRHLVAALLIVIAWAAVTAVFLAVIQPHLALLAVAVAMSGAAGGIVFAVRDSNLVWPALNDGEQIRLGWIADCLYGVAGSFAVFLVIPNFSEGAIDAFAASIRGAAAKDAGADLLEVIGVALVGGFAGRSVLKLASDRILQEKIERVERSVAEAKREITERVEAADEKLRDLEPMKHDSDALAVVARQLNTRCPAPSAAELRDAVAAASPRGRDRIVAKVRGALLLDKTGVADRAIPVLEAVRHAGNGEPPHPISALLAEAHAAAGDREQALTFIEEAIRVRDAVDPEAGRDHLHYDELRAQLVGD